MKFEKTKSGKWKKAFKFFPQIKLCPKVIKLIQPYTNLLFINYAVYFIYAGLKVIKPRFLGGVVDIVSKSKDAEDLKDLLVSMAIYHVVFGLVTRFQISMTVKISHKVEKQLKPALYKNILEKDLEFFDKTPSNDIISAVNNGMEEIQNLSLQRMIGPLEAVFRTVVTLALLYEISPKLTGLALFIAPSKLYMMYSNWSVDQQMVSKQTDLITQLKKIPQTAIQNISLIKTFSSEKKEVDDFGEKVKEVCHVQKIIVRESWLWGYIRSLADQGFQIFLIWYGGMMVFEGTLTAGQLSTFTLHFANFIDSLGLIKTSTEALINSLTRCERLFDVLEYEPEVKASNPEGITDSEFKGEIEIRNMSFSYPTRPDMDVLSNINLTIKPGDVMAFVGTSGSGKNTLTYLLQGLYNPTQGDILVDGEDIRKYDLRWLHQNVGYVPQDITLLDKTIRENIAYGMDSYTDEQMTQAIKLANAEFLLDQTKFPDGLDTIIGTDGLQLAGGQKQSIVLARALMKDPKILILNEPSFGQDGTNEAQVQRLIETFSKCGEKTVIVVTQKIFTIRCCKRICVFENGKLAEEGGHNELIEKGGAYSRLYGKQFEQRLFSALIHLTSQHSVEAN